jgi:hypothetical protein
VLLVETTCSVPTTGPQNTRTLQSNLTTVCSFRAYKGNNGGGREAGHHRHHTEEKTTIVWPRQKDARGENTEINCGMDTGGEIKKRMFKKNVDGRSTSSQDNKKFRTIAVEKQGGMAFGFRKMATAVIKLDGSIDD